MAHKVLFGIALIVASIPLGSAAADGLEGKTIKATGTQKVYTRNYPELGTVLKSNITMYIGTKGHVYNYTENSQGIVFTLGQPRVGQSG